jgi:hypothetical protein
MKDALPPHRLDHIALAPNRSAPTALSNSGRITELTLAKSHG